MFCDKIDCRKYGEVAVGKAAAGLPAVMGQTIRRVRIPSLSAIFFPELRVASIVSALMRPALFIRTPNPDEILIYG